MDKDVVAFKDLIKIEVISLDSFDFLNYDILSPKVISNLMLRFLLMRQWDILTEHHP